MQAVERDTVLARPAGQLPIPLFLQAVTARERSKAPVKAHNLRRTRSGRCRRVSAHRERGESQQNRNSRRKS
jgi:hypothetical protein